MYLAIYQKHVGNETNGQITLSKAEKLQRAILKVEDEHGVVLTAPSADDKRDDDDNNKERITSDERGLF
jgi:hypothetical protein